MKASVKKMFDTMAQNDKLWVMEKLLTVDETLEVLRITRSTLYRHIRSGLLTPVKLGNRTLFREKDLERFIETLPKKDQQK
jgi:excisionase family DNA binding protein